jgi:RNA polymerase sigma-70 factor (ECF subfamily)
VFGSNCRTSALFKRHRDDLFRYLSRYVSDPDLADDIVQETFIRLQDRAPPDRTNIRGWLFTVATNLARDAMSVSKRRRELEAIAGPDLPAPNTPADPGSMAELADLRQRVRRSLASLSDEERTVLLLYQEGFRHREIAEVVNRKTEAIGSIVVRAAEKVAKVVRKEATA